MSSDTSSQAQGSFSSNPTVVSLRSERLLDLGKRIVEELGPDQEIDTLARWMAHYIAELIEAAEAANSEDRPGKMAACAAAILDLWRHRRQLPDGRRPFEDLEPILRTLESLDLGDDRPRYYHVHRHEANECKEGSGVRQWLGIADRLDDSAKILIHYCLACASQRALDKSKAWVALAEAAGLQDGVELPVVRLISAESDLLEALELDNSDRKRIEDRIRRLEHFKEMSDVLLSDLRKRLEQAETTEEQS